jgi:hypothetical protein
VPVHHQAVRTACDWSKGPLISSKDSISSSPSQVDPFSQAFRVPAANTTIMSSTIQVTATSPSSNFQLIFSAALKAYEKQTKRDLLAHPLASQLQTCDSLGSILAVLQSQVDDLGTGDERLTKWLSPTVNVLLAFSNTLGEGVSLVLRPKLISCWDYALTVTTQVFHPRKRYSQVLVSSSRSVSF